MMRQFDARRARWLTLRAHLGFFLVWLPLSSLFLLFSPAALVIGFAGTREDLGWVSGICVTLGVGWLGVYLLLCFGSVWWYRRRIGPTFVSGEPGSRMEARRLAEVEAHFVQVGGPQIIGVDVASCEPTRVVRFVNGHVALVLHFTTVGLMVVAYLDNT